MSIYGLMSVFVNSATVMIFMGMGMEIGKILTVSHLYRHWQKLNGLTRTMYVLIVSILVLITSIEIIGFLTQTHTSITRNLQINETAQNALKEEAAILKEQISIINITLDGLPISHVSRRINERKVSGYDKKQARLMEISKQKAQLEAQIIQDRELAGPIFAVARIMRISETDAAAIFILLLVLVLEPLSIGLTVAACAAWMPSETISEPKSQQPRSVEELKVLCKKYQLTIAQLAKITGRKKQKTCEEWLNGTTHVPVRALRDVRTWSKKQYFESTHDKKVITISTK